MIERKLTNRAKYNDSKNKLKQEIEKINNEIKDKQSLLTKNIQTLQLLKLKLTQGMEVIISQTDPNKKADNDKEKKPSSVKISLNDVMSMCSSVPQISAGGNRNKLRVSKLKKIHTKKSHKRHTKKSYKRHAKKSRKRRTKKSRKY